MNAGGLFLHWTLNASTIVQMVCGVAGCIRESQIDSAVRRDFITDRIFWLN